jgi:hypothetical protein
VTAYPAWTPASRPGIIPLHPLSFGVILGRSFSALRSNPRVLLGFALVVQTLAYLVMLAAIGGVAFASFTRLDTLQPGSDEYDAVFAGSTAITIIVGFVLSLAAGALSVIVQGIVVTEVAHAAVAEKLSLGALWRQVKPVAWRLIGYAVLVGLVVVGAVAIVAFGVIMLGVAAGPAAFLLAIPVLLASIPLTLWLTVKLLLVPAAIILEHASIGRAIARSWTLTRRRFWSTLGVIVLISLVFGFVAQAVTVPFSLLGSGLGTIVAPTGAPNETAVIGIIVAVILPQAISLLIQAVAVVVQSTATSIIYIDCRMRHEGLDLDLLTYVERRDAGATSLPDPYLENIGRTAVPRPAYGYPAPGYPAYGPAPTGPQPYGQPAYGQPPYGQPAYGQPAQGQPYTAQPAYAAPQYAAPVPAPPPTGAHDAPASPTGAAAGPEPTTWAAPEAPADGSDRESPWS